MMEAITSVFVPRQHSKMQKRYLDFCQRLAIPTDKVTFFNGNEVRIKCGRLPRTEQTARSLQGHIPYQFRKDEGIFNVSFEFRFDGNYCLIKFIK